MYRGSVLVVVVIVRHLERVECHERFRCERNLGRERRRRSHISRKLRLLLPSLTDDRSPKIRWRLLATAVIQEQNCRCVSASFRHDWIENLFRQRNSKKTNDLCDQKQFLVELVNIIENDLPPMVLGFSFQFSSFHHDPFS